VSVAWAEVSWGDFFSWRVDGEEGGCTCDGMVSCIVWSNVAVAVAVETCHGLLAEEPEGFLEYWMLGSVNVTEHPIESLKNANECAMDLPLRDW